MIFEIITYYKNSLGLNNLLFKHLRWYVKCFSLLFLFISFGFIIYLSIVYSSNYMYLAVIPTFIAFLPVNIEFKRVLKKEYKIDSRIGLFALWNNFRFYRMRRELAFDHIETIVQTKDQYNFLLKTIESHCKEFKPPFFINSVAFGIFFVPLWVIYLAWIFLHIKNFSEATRMFFLLNFIVLNFFLILFTFKMLFYESLLNRDYNILLRIQMDIETLYIRKLGVEWKEDNST